MPRKLRIEYENALYHVLNRGNYRRDVFETEGAAQAFLKALAEGSAIYGWRVHAFVVMRNHYHLAIETPKFIDYRTEVKRATILINMPSKSQPIHRNGGVSRVAPLKKRSVGERRRSTGIVSSVIAMQPSLYR